MQVLTDHPVITSTDNRASAYIAAAYLGIMSAFAVLAAGVVLVSERILPDTPSNIAYTFGVSGIGLLWLAFGMAMALAHLWDHQREARLASLVVFILGFSVFLALFLAASAPWTKISWSIT